jgi:4-amino-4-deoxy-L-arabinose transferase-like glycosyltransferase
VTAVIGTADVRPAAEAPPAAGRKAAWLPLALILVAQALLTARLFRAGIASDDEARYIYTGHQLILELWHGGGSPYFETYLSGAPVIYPVLAAMADHVGGLVAVRLMSLVFMLAATIFLNASAGRLFGYAAGLAAAGLFAGLGLTQDLGALATYDAMSLMLVAAAAYCAVRTGRAERHAGRWLLLVPVALLAANATKYVTVVFDPVVIGLAAAQVADQGGKRVLQRVAALGTATGCVIAMAVLLAGSAYVKGIMFTTLSRPAGAQVVIGASATPGRAILSESGAWIGAILVLGALATAYAVAIRRDPARAALLALLVAAGLLVTLEALRLHSNESMQKHDDFGAWFTCIAAGYLLSAARTRATSGFGRLAATAVAAVAVLASGAYYSARALATYEGGNDTAYLAAYSSLRPYLNRPGRYLLGGLTDDELLYTEHLSVPWYAYFDDVYIKYPVPGRGGDGHGQALGPACQVLRPGCMYLEGVAGYRAAIHAHWFTLITMIGNHAAAQDTAIEQAVEDTPGYVLLTRAGGQPTWIYAPAYRAQAPQSPFAGRGIAAGLARPPGEAAAGIPGVGVLGAGHPLLDGQQRG